MGSAGLVRKPMVFMDEGTMVSRVVFTFFSSPSRSRVSKSATKPPAVASGAAAAAAGV